MAVSIAAIRRMTEHAIEAHPERRADLERMRDEEIAYRQQKNRLRKLGDAAGRFLSANLAEGK